MLLGAAISGIPRRIAARFLILRFPFNGAEDCVTTLIVEEPACAGVNLGVNFGASSRVGEVSVLLSRPTATHHAASKPVDAIGQCVQAALTGAQLERQIERRTETRHPYPYPIHMTPVDRSGRPLLDETFVVVGKHLSNHGVDFYFAQPLEWSRVIASFPLHDGAWLGLLMDLTWCRFSRHGWYDNGGRFVSVVESPLAVPLAA